jgi:hypothetical protein
MQLEQHYKEAKTNYSSPLFQITPKALLPTYKAMSKSRKERKQDCCSYTAVAPSLFARFGLPD